jgi:hypothetical protein
MSGCDLFVLSIKQVVNDAFPKEGGGDVIECKSLDGPEKD